MLLLLHLPALSNFWLPNMEGAYTTFHCFLPLVIFCLFYHFHLAWVYKFHSNHNPQFYFYLDPTFNYIYASLTLLCHSFSIHLLVFEVSPLESSRKPSTIKTHGNYILWVFAYSKISIAFILDLAVNTFLEFTFLS